MNITGFKSGLLVSICKWIKKYHKGYKTKKGRIPTVLYITLENGIDETIERIFNMSVTPEDIRGYSPKEVVKLFKEKGDFFLDGEDDINICYQYYANREIDTSDLYTIIEDLEDEGLEVIVLVLDYLKRIRPAERGRDEKEELKNVTNELKSLATELDIPVITAHQLNREGARVVDNAAIQNKEDLTHFLGRSNVGSAWEVIENSDWSCIINIEKRKSDGRYFLTIKRIKIRYKDPNDEYYFNHPFEEGNRIKLMDDVDLPTSLSEASLATDMEAVSFKKGRRNAIKRDVEESGDEFDPSSEIG